MKNNKSSHSVAPFVIILVLLIAGAGFVMSKLFPSGGDKSNSAAVTVDEKITEVYNTVTDSYPETVTVSEISDYVDTLYEATDELIEDGTIVYREKQDTCVYVRDKDGTGVFLTAPNEELASSGSHITYFCYQPFYDEFNVPGLNVDMVDSLQDEFGALDFVNPSAKIYKDRSVTIETAKQFASDSVILWDGHGLYCDELGSCLALSYRVSTWDCFDDYLNNRLCYCLSDDDVLTAITPLFFDYYYSSGSLDNSVIYLGACSSGLDRMSASCYADRSLSQVFLDKGARTVFANSDVIYAYYCNLMSYSILSAMAHGSSAGEALMSAREQHGANDHVDNAPEPKADAEVLLFGDSGYTLRTANIYTDTQYGWSVVIPDEWFRYGTYVQTGDNTRAGFYGQVRFCHKELNDSIGRGLCFTIVAVPVNSSRDDGVNAGTASGGYLGRNDSYSFYWIEATDVQADPDASADEQQRQREELAQLNALSGEILSSFRLQ